MHHLKQLQDHIDDFGFGIYYKVCEEFENLQMPADVVEAAKRIIKGAYSDVNYVTSGQLHNDAILCAKTIIERHDRTNANTD